MRFNGKLSAEKEKFPAASENAVFEEFSAEIVTLGKGALLKVSNILPLMFCAKLFPKQKSKKTSALYNFNS